MLTLDDHIAKFRNYARAKLELCRQDPAPLELKLDHTLKVLAYADQIVKNENLSPELTRACQLAALYHDIARFDQYLKYNTFRDPLSFNHGLEAVRILKSMNFLADEPMQRPILTAIACHNKPTLPKTLAREDLLIASILRNADKLDILRVIARHLEHKPYNPTVILSLPDDDNIYGEIAISKAMAGITPLYDDLRSVNDFRVLLGMWFYDLQFPGSRRIYLENGYGKNIVSQLPDNHIYGKIRNKLLRLFSEGI